MRKKDYDFTPTTIGEHIKKKRLQLELTQKQVAKRLSVTQFSIINWEIGDHQPDDAPTLHRIIRFLGYDPLPTGSTIPELLRAKRRELGMGQRELATHLGVDPKTVLYWEQDGNILKHQHRKLVAKFLGMSESDTQELMRRRWNDSHGRATPSEADVIWSGKKYVARGRRA